MLDEETLCKSSWNFLGKVPLNISYVYLLDTLLNIKSKLTLKIIQL